MGTPESVKIRRMKFEIEIESPSSRQRRARSASTSVGDSPSKIGSPKHSRRKLLYTVSSWLDEKLMIRTFVVSRSTLQEPKLV
jgi:hypothetical protein